jgi:hypothetical protein
MASDIEVTTPPRRKKFGGLNTLLLPMSKVKVLVRRPSMFSLVASGGLPGELTSLVWRLFGNDGTVTLGTMLEEGSPEVKNFSMLVEKLLPHVLVSVKVADESDCEEDDQGVLRGNIALIDIPDIDKNHIFLYAVGVLKGRDEIGEVVAADLEAFRDRAARGDAGHDVQEVQPAPVLAGGDEPAGPAGV